MEDQIAPSSLSVLHDRGISISTLGQNQNQNQQTVQQPSQSKLVASV